MRYLLAILLAAPAFGVDAYLRDAAYGACRITAATTANPSVVTIANWADCGNPGNGDIVGVYGVIGATGLNVRVNDASDFDNLARVLRNKSGNTFTLEDLAGNPISGAVDGSCAGAASTHAGNCAYIAGGRLGKVIARTLKAGPKMNLDGTGGARTTARASAPYADSANPDYDVFRTDAASYRTNNASLLWGWTHLRAGGTGGAVNAVGGIDCLHNALDWFATGSAPALAYAKWCVDNPDQYMGGLACNQASPHCDATISGQGDYGKQFMRELFQAYTIIKGELTGGQIARFEEYFLNDKPWFKHGIDYTAANHTIQPYTKLRTDTTHGTISGSALGTTITGSGTTFTTQCAVGGNITPYTQYGLPSRITAISSDTSITVEAPIAEGFSAGTHFYCENAWQTGDIGWVGWHKFSSTGPLNGAAEFGDSTNSTGYAASAYYGPIGGFYQDGTQNLAIVRAIADFQAGIVMGDTDNRALLLAQQADAWFMDVSRPYALSLLSPGGWNGTPYWADRCIGVYLEWALQRVNSFTDAENPFPASFFDDVQDYVRWSALPGLFIRPSFYGGPDYFVGKEIRPGFIGMTMAPSSTASQSLQWWIQNANAFQTGAGGNYTDGSTQVLAGYSGTHWLFYEPATTATQPTDLHKFFKSNKATCLSIYSAADCDHKDELNLAMSRSHWSGDGTATIVAFPLTGFANRDHGPPDQGGYVQIFVNKQPMLAGDGVNFLGTGAIDSTATAGRGYPIVDGVSRFVTYPSEVGTPYKWRSGDAGFMHVAGDLTDIYTGAAAVTSMERQVVHLRVAGGPNYVAVRTTGAMSSPKSFRGSTLYNLNGCGTASSTSCISATTDTVQHTQTTTGKKARLHTKLLPISAALTYTTENGSLSNGSFTNGGGQAFRVDVTPSGNVTAIDYIEVHQPCANDTCSAVTPVLGSEDGFDTVDIPDGSHPFRLMLTKDETTIASTSFTLAADRDLVIVGLDAGTYDVTVDGSPVSGCTGLVVASGEHSLHCDDVAAGVVSVAAASAPAATGGVRFVGPVRGTGRVRLQ